VTQTADQRKIRLLLVSHSLTGGGAERFASTLLDRLDRGRFAPSACLVTDRSTYPVPDDVEVSTLGYRGLRHLPRSLSRLRRTIERLRPDVVLSNVLSTNCLTGGALAGLADPPPWVARVGLAPEKADPLLHKLWARRCYPRARSVVCNSQRMAKAFARIYPEAGARVVSIPNPTDFQRLEALAAEPPQRAADGGQTLISVGRLTRQKRFDVLLRALARVRQDFDVRLWICGEGPLRRRIEGWIEELKLEDGVEMPGFCDNPFALMRQADLYVMTSDFEGLPNALIEAQGLGLPAVATDCPYGPAEIVEDGVTGRLVPTADPMAVARAVIEILGDSERRRRMAAEAARRARRRFDVARVLPRWQKLLEEAAAAVPGAENPVGLQIRRLVR